MIPAINKKAQMGEAVLWIYRFILIALISLFIVIIVGNKYSEKYDFRQAESALLSKRIVNCIEIYGADRNMIVNCLGINFKDYYVNISTQSLESNSNNSIFFGNSDLKIQCDLLKLKKKLKQEPSCSESNYFILLNNEKTKLKIEIAMGKYDKVY